MVTYVGLMFAMLMLASAWTTMGMGDTLLLKLRSQELADAAVYSSAVTNAQGMNFIATLNVAMLALTGTYVASQKVLGVLNAATDLNPNTNNGGESVRDLTDGTTLPGDPVVGAQWRVVKNWGRADAGKPARNFGCAAKIGECDEDDERATCKFQEDHFRPFGKRTDYCEVAKAITDARITLAGDDATFHTGKMGLKGYEKVVIGEAFGAIATMQFAIAKSQGTIGNYLGSTMKVQAGQSGQDNSIDRSNTTAQVVSVASKSTAGNYKHTAAFASSSSVVGDSSISGVELPVTPHKASDLCLYVGANTNKVGDGIVEYGGVGPLPAVANEVRDSVKGVAEKRASGGRATEGGSILTVGIRHGSVPCGDGQDATGKAIWQRDVNTAAKLNGPMLMAGGPSPASSDMSKPALQNGGVGFQSVSLISSQMSEGQVTRVGKPFAWFGSLKSTTPVGTVAANAKNENRAQAEFYLHCAINGGLGVWDDSHCNGNNMAMFRLQWRARLVPLPRAPATPSPALKATGLDGAGSGEEPKLNTTDSNGNGLGPIKNTGSGTPAVPPPG